MPHDTLVLSILLLTYNHQAYLRDALDGIFFQELDVAFEVIATEDKSNDKTRVILEEYQGRYPGVLTILPREERVGGKRNLLDGFSRCRGDYICVLDGDDYWTSPTKLSRQLGILLRHPEYSGCAHNTKVMFAQNIGYDYNFVRSDRIKDAYTLGDLISGKIYLHTSSLLFRNVFKGGLPAAQRHPLTGDYFMSMLFAEYGDIAFINQVMSVYRVTGQGEWSRLSPLIQRMKNVDGLVVYNRLLNYRHWNLFDRRIHREIKKLLRILVRKHSWSLGCLCKYLFLLAAYKHAHRHLELTRRPVLCVLVDRLWFTGSIRFCRKDSRRVWLEGQHAQGLIRETLQKVAD